MSKINQFTMQDPRYQYDVSDTHKNDDQPDPGLDEILSPKSDHGEKTYEGSGRLKGRKALGPVDLCCIYFTQQYMGSHIIENASDTMLA
jgi:hypothetical protein